MADHDLVQRLDGVALELGLEAGGEVADRRARGRYRASREDRWPAGSSAGASPTTPLVSRVRTSPLTLISSSIDRLRHGQRVAKIAVLVLPWRGGRAGACELPALHRLRAARQRRHAQILRARHQRLGIGVGGGMLDADQHGLQRRPGDDGRRHQEIVLELDAERAVRGDEVGQELVQARLEDLVDAAISAAAHRSGRRACGIRAASCRQARPACRSRFS